MGVAAGTAKHAADLFASCGPLMNVLPAYYKGNWQTKTEQSAKIAK